MHLLKPYQTDWLTQVMQFFSIAGDGELFFFGICALFVVGRSYDFQFLIICMTNSFYVQNLLKIVLHHSRPQFDAPSISLRNESSTCSGEFGNPSGHVQMTAQVVLCALEFYRHEHKEWFSRHPILSRTLYALALIFFLLFLIQHLSVVLVVILGQGRGKGRRGDGFTEHIPFTGGDCSVSPSLRCA